MKALLINNFHYPRGGSEKAYFDTAEILKSHGHEVAFFSTKHPKNNSTEWEKYFIDNVDYNSAVLSVWQKIKMAVNIIFNFQVKKNLEKLILDFKPDVAHLHNIYHQLSPSVIYALKKHNIPMVMTLHDYKLISPNYSLFLNGKIWEKKSFISCITDKCIKSSYLKSTLGALEKFFHDLFGSYEKINMFIPPSKFLMNKFREFGFQGKMEYIPNPINNLFFNTEITNDDNSGPLVYYGRLSKEKGIETVIRAMKYVLEEKLQIIGEGPEKENLVVLTKKLNLESKVFLLGYKSGQELKGILSKAKAIIIPSIWYENMPYAIAESLAMGKIVIASKIGGIPDLICDGENGFLFEAGSSKELAQKIESLKKYDLPAIKIRAGKRILEYNEKKYYEKILAVYKRTVLSKD